MPGEASLQRPPSLVTVAAGGEMAPVHFPTTSNLDKHTMSGSKNSSAARTPTDIRKAMEKGFRNNGGFVPQVRHQNLSHNGAVNDLFSFFSDTLLFSSLI